MREKSVLAVDLGGTKLAYQLALGRFVIASAVVSTKHDFEAQLVDIFRELQAKVDQIDVVSIGVPGPVQKGIMGPSFPLKTNHDVDFNLLFPDARTILVRNDVQMAAFAELTEGRGMNFENFCLVSLSTGIRVGVVVNKNVINFRSEMGHQIIVHSDNDICQCPDHQGCWAGVCSGAAIKANRFTKDHYEFIREINTVAFVNIICAYDPQIIFVMGGIGRNLFNEVVPTKLDIAKKIRRSKVPEIELSSINERIGVVGAAAMAGLF